MLQRTYCNIIFYFLFSILITPGLIKQFLKDVDWGELDYLIIDTPPGTSDEHLSLVQYLAETSVEGAVIVTTPQVILICPQPLSQ